MQQATGSPAVLIAPAIQSAPNRGPSASPGLQNRAGRGVEGSDSGAQEGGSGRSPGGGATIPSQSKGHVSASEVPLGAVFGER